MPEDLAPPQQTGSTLPGGLRIVAAGSVLWRSASREQVAVVHRHRYDDLCLPKGKVDSGETLVDCALRETAEETGFRGRLQGWGGELVYSVDGYEKSVVFFELFVDQRFEATPPDPTEVLEVLWLTPQDALDSLAYDGERNLLAKLIQRHGELDGIRIKP